MSAARFAFAAPAIAALGAMIAGPVAAAELPARPAVAQSTALPSWSEGDMVQHNHRYRRYRRDRGLDGGDILAGVLILGGIAAVASAATRDRDVQRVPTRYPQQDRDYRSTRGEYRTGDGLSNAADMCVEEIERERRVENVDQVQRLASGWVVTGTTFDSQDFVCTIGQNGRIESIDYAGTGTAQGYSDDDETYAREREEDYYASRTPVEDRQYEDDRYNAERARLGGQPAPQYQDDGAAPAYPGGPLPGDDDRPLYEGE